MSKTYHEKLLLPQWRSRRDIILWRDGHKCSQCTSSQNLHVHHERYISGREPWQYRDYDLVTLCEFCHSRLHERNDYRKEVERSRTKFSGLRSLGEVLQEIST